MRRALLGSSLALLALLATSCAPGDTPYFGDDECIGNTAPRIGNLEINSAYIVLAEQWALCFHVDWEDPGVDETGARGTDAPNMFGGLFSLELGGVLSPNRWIDEGPAPVGVTIGAPQGELEYRGCFVDEALLDQQVHYALRLRDRCGLASNEKTGTYYLGGGADDVHYIENPEVGASGCDLPPTICVQEPVEE